MKLGWIPVLAVLSMLSASSVGPAPPSATSPVTFNATLSGPLPDFFDIPVSPPVSSVNETGTGQADLLGSFQWIGHLMQQGGLAPPTPRVASEGIGVMKTSAEDALFFRYTGKVVVGIDSQARELAFVITGGQGRFLGATGGGLFRDNIDYNLAKFTRSVEGTLSLREVK